MSAPAAKPEYALQLPLIGVEIEGAEYHTSVFHGWIGPNIDGHGFDVPRPGCFFIPPFDPEMYRAVRGKKVEIHIGHISKKGEE